MNGHRIPTKRGTEIRFNELFKCAKFQPDCRMHWCFMADVAKLQNEEGNEEIKTKFWPLVSQKSLERFSSNEE